MSQNLTPEPELTEKNKSVKLASSEIFIVLVLLILFVISNLITCYLQPVWLDEGMHADPAVNLYLGNGFNSSAWFYQPKEEFWAQNAPLHAIILYHWMLLFGFNPVAVRSLNYVLMAASVLLIWLSVYRLKLVNSTETRIILIALLTLGSSITFNYITGRYDCVGISIFSLAFFTYSLKSSWLRSNIFICLGIFIPMAGFHLVPYVVILGLLLLIYLRKAFLREFVSIAIGVIIGIVFLYILYCTNMVTVVALKSMGGHALAGTINDNARKIIGNAGLQEKIFFVMNNLPEIIGNRLKNFPKWFSSDRSFLILLFLLIGIAIDDLRNNIFKKRSVVSFGLLASFSIPIVLGIVKDYPFYYNWMAYIPLAICTSSAIAEFRKNNRSLIAHLLILFLIVLSCLPGYIQRVTSSIPQWSDLDYSRVEKFIDTSITSNDVVYSEFEAYYPVKKKAKYAIFPPYLDIISSQEKAEISVLVINPQKTEEFARIVNIIGGKWVETKDKLESQIYNLRIFRRKSDI
jgi:hypothetical protein